MNSTLIKGVAELHAAKRARMEERYAELLEHGTSDNVGELHEIAAMLSKSIEQIQADHSAIRNVAWLETIIEETNAAGLLKSARDAREKHEQFSLETRRIIAERQQVELLLETDVAIKFLPTRDPVARENQLTLALSANPALFRNRKRVKLKRPDATTQDVAEFESREAEDERRRNAGRGSRF